jgi:hypothetical protein
VQKLALSEREEIKVYFSSAEFMNKTPAEGRWYTKVKKKEGDYVHCHKIFNGLDHTILKDPNLPWAINVNGVDYLNLRYCDQYRNEDVYAKYEIEGKICALFISGETSGRIKEGGDQGYQYGGGLFGYLIADSSKWGNNWRDKMNNKVKILTINTTRRSPRTKKLFRKHLSKLLTKDNFNDELNSNYTKDQIDNFSFEQVVEIILKINASDG